MIKIPSFNTRSCNRPTEQGFSLLELTIALLVASIIIGTIWVSAEQVWDGYRVSRAVQQVTKITENIRGFYMNAKQLPGPTGTDMTVAMDTDNLFPLEMRRSPAGGAGGSIDNPFNNQVVGGSFHVTSLNCKNGPAVTTCFRIRMQGLESGVCVRLLKAIPVNDADLGIVAVGTGNGVPLQLFAADTLGTPAAVVASTARGWCIGAGATNEVDWDFKLHH